MKLYRKKHFFMPTLLSLSFCLLIAVFSIYGRADNLIKSDVKQIVNQKLTTDSAADIVINGVIKVDFLYDINAPSGDRINYTSISTDESNVQGNTRIHARESRLGIKFLQKILDKEISAFIEGDFYGGGTNSPSGSETISNGSAFRLRHAYLSYDQWLVGQTWSNYVDVKSFPETLDFSNETGQAFIRQGQIRYQHKFNNFLLSYSLENPETDVYILKEMFGNNTRFQAVDPSVDFTAKAQYLSSWGHLSLQMVARKQKVYVDSTSVSELSYGLGGSGKIQLTVQDFLKFHYSQGLGIGRYIQEAAGASGLILQLSSEPENEMASLKLLSAKGGYLGYQHIFNKSLRMNINSGFIDIDYSPIGNTNFIADRTKQLTSFHGNLIWSIRPDFEIGIEHSIAKLKTVSGEYGTIKRLQLSTTFRF